LERELSLNNWISSEAIRPAVRLEDGGQEGRIKNKCQWDDRFPGRPTHVSPTALQLAHDAPKSEPDQETEIVNKNLKAKT